VTSCSGPKPVELTTTTPCAGILVATAHRSWSAFALSQCRLLTPCKGLHDNTVQNVTTTCMAEVTMSASKPGLLALLHRANQVANEQFAASLGVNITARQVHVLVAIDAHEGASQTKIVELTGVDRSTLADIMRRLQRNRLVERRRSKTDARAYVLKLTDAGREALALSKPALDGVEGQLLGTLPSKQRSELMAMLGKIAEFHKP